MYDDIIVSENEEDHAIDAAGFTGNFRRENNKKNEILSDIEIIECIKSDNKLSEVMKFIY
jgi:hypothetical protein